MNLLHLQYLLYTIKDGICFILVLMFFERVRMYGFGIKDYLKCPYFYLFLLINQVNKAILGTTVLSIILSFMAYWTFVEVIRRYINDNKQ